MIQDTEKYKAALKKAAEKITELSNELKKNNEQEEIAIIGYSCRFPGGANHPESFWKILENGIDTVTEIKESRFDKNQFFSDDMDAIGKMYTKHAAFLEAPIEEFDNTHFEISAVEAASIDPQQRLLLEVSWESLENAGINIERLRGSRTGVFIGINSLDYVKAEMLSGNVNDINAYSTTGTSFNAASGRLAYFYDFKGPAVSYDTACSSSLVALNGAVQSLKNNDCDLAIVGGVNLLLSPESFIGLSKTHGLSRDGRCKVFDAAADGFGRGEGCGVVILKRLNEAKRDKNNIDAIVKSVFVGQDGKTNGFTAPNGLSQKNVIMEALKQANLTANDIDYIETHGTGTELGDFIEAQAISSIPREGRMLIGSAKSNIAHLEAASGMAGLIKILLSLKHNQIPPSIHYKNPNSNIDWTKVKVVDKLIDWKKQSGKRRAGISSFGFSGTLAHVILEEPPVSGTEQRLNKLPYHIMTLSGKNEKALWASIKNMKQFLEENQESVADICYTTNISRGFMDHKFSMEAEKKEDFIKGLDEVLNNPDKFSLYTSKKQHSVSYPIAFLFTGQNSIYKNIAKSFYTLSVPFKEMLDLCNEKFRKELNIEILDAMYDEDESLMKTPLYSQPIIFSIECALTKVWESFGIKPKIVIGHSIGEYAAAYYGGHISLDEAVLMISRRSKMMESVNIDGKMVGVLTDAESVKAAIIESGCKNVSIAAMNAPQNVTISGLSNEIDKVIEIIQKKQKVFINKLDIEHPYHSKLMIPYTDDFARSISEVSMKNPRFKMISTVTGKLENADTLGTTTYWAEHLSKMVRFQDAIETAKKMGITIFIEIGGDATLSGLANQCINDENVDFLPSLRKGVPDYKQIFHSLSTLFLRGIDIDWNAFYETYEKKRVNLPNYPFQRKKFLKEVRSVAKAESHKKMEDEEPLEIKEQNKGVEEAKVNEANINKIDGVKGRKNADQISLELKEIINLITGFETDEIDSAANLFSLGFDSLILMSFKKKIEGKYHLDISLNQFFEELNTIDKISRYIHNHYKESHMEILCTNEIFIESKDNLNNTNENSPQSSVSSSLFDNQINSIQNQLEQLRKMSREKMADSELEKEAKERSAPIDLNYSSWVFEKDQLNEKQKRYIHHFLKKYNEKTEESKEYAAKYRYALADWINSLNFRTTLKELLYPVVASHSEGSRFWDVDGNEYLDLAIGYGVHYFGHNPPFIKEAIKNQLDKGIELGPQSQLAGKVAELIKELTKVERVSFCNTGTEAVMVAVRIARAASKKKRIVKFAGSYHGTFDAVLSGADDQGEFPSSEGTTYGAVKDTVSLMYGSKESLEYIEQHQDEIAAVLVEPVQSRKPGFQPKDFLLRLRELTSKTGIILIFDEMVTGFRIQQGGAQAYFGIQADIVTYGKIVGGGMPIGVVAGKEKYLDMIDGGAWEFGDESKPQNKTVVFAGTFCKNPLSMASAYAVLSYMKEKGESLQNEVNEKTRNFVERINQFFETENVSMNVKYFGSQFKFESFGKYDPSLLPIEMDLFYYLLMYKGIYTWERRTCCFNTAITEEDIYLIEEKIKETIFELREAGFFTIQEAVDNCIPMSLAQKNVYTHILKDGQDPYNIIGVLEMKGKVDPEKIEVSFKKIIAKHDILRTRLYVENEELLSDVVGNVDFKVNVIKKDASKSLEQVIDETITKFDLAKAPLFKVTLIEITEKEYALLIDIHHTIGDGMSLNILAQEFVQAYCDGDLKPLTMQYKDYVKWENHYLESDVAKKDESYWLGKLSGEITPVNIPVDSDVALSGGYIGNTVSMKIKEDLVANLKNLAMKNESSLFMVLVAAYNVLLHKLSNDHEILIGTPVTTRNNGHFDNCIGMFTNTIVLKNKVHKNKTFKEFLNEVKQNLIEVYSHMEYPFQLLVNKLNVNREYNGNPIINTMFVYENINERVFKLKDVEVKKYDYKGKTTTFDFLFEILEENGRFDVNLKYKVDLFKEDTITRWGKYFESILNEIVENEKIVISDIQVLSSEEKNKLFVDFNDTFYQYPINKTIHQLFEEQTEKTPNHIAVVFEDTSMTYKELNEKANALGRTLREKGVELGSITGIMLERSIDMVISILAVLKAGGAYLPIDPEFPSERVKYILENSKANLFITSGVLNHELQNSCTIVNIEDKKLYEKEVNNLDLDVKSEMLAYIIYTSGSTGSPKGVMIEHRNVHNLILGLYKNIYSDYKDYLKIALVSPFYFDASVKQIFAALCQGHSLYIVPENTRKDGFELLKYYETNQIEVSDGTPMHVSMIASLINSDDQLNLQHLIIGGDQLSLELVKKIYQYIPDIKISNVYGPTECCVDSTIFSITAQNIGLLKKIYIGKPMTNYQIFIVDEDKQIVPIGVAGEICVSGDGVARGYINNPALTNEKFIDNPYVKGKKMYKTGDIARWLSDGKIEFLGRKDYQVKIKGYRIELEEIESKLLEIEGIKEAVVIDIERDGTKYLSAYYVSEEKLDVPMVRKQLSKNLPEYMIPSYFTFLAKIPLTSNGKIDRKALKLPEGDMITGTEYVAPRNEIEEILTSVWAGVLGAKQIGINDNFFHIGGDSIKAIQVVSRMKSLGYTLEVKNIFDSLRISELSSKVKTNHLKLSQEEVEGIVELTPIQKWFFEENAIDRHHWNQAFLLFKKEGFNEEIVMLVFNKIIQHHDALRIVCQYTKDGHVLKNESYHEKMLDIQIIDYREQDLVDETEITEICNAAQRSIDLENGPLFKFVLFKMKAGDQLLIIMHHLVIDGVSWRIILEDFQNSYALAKNNPKIVLPEKTTSFKEWSNKLNLYAHSFKIEKELEYWKNVESMEVKKVPKDKESATVTMKTAKTIYEMLTKDETELLLKRVNKAYSTEINDILISALARTMSRFINSSKVLIKLESHGREPIIENVDITRTVGWFTCHYPIVIQNYANISTLIKNTKDYLRRVPNKGIGYGIIKYLSASKDKHHIDFKLKPDIKFNYLGQFDQDINTDVFEISKINYGDVRSLDSEMNVPLDFESMVVNGKLNFLLTYNSNEYEEETIQTIIKDLKQNLLDMIHHCTAKTEVEKTAADLTKEPITLEQLSIYKDKLNNIQEIYPLSPMQEGILFNSRMNDESEAYHVSLALEIEGRVDQVSLETAFNKLIEKYDVLRTNFDYESFDKEMQIVYKEKKVNITFIDISDTEINKEEFVKEKMIEDRKVRFDLRKDVLIRMYLIKHHENKYSVILSNHHLLFDGWCMDMILRDLFTMYGDVQSNKSLKLENVPVYSSYIEWLKNKNRKEAEDYWQDYLADFQEISKIPFEGSNTDKEYMPMEHVIVIPKNRLNKLESIATNHNVTLNAVIQGIWSIQLQKYNHTNDCVFGYVVSGRNPEIEGIEKMVGLFINSVPMRVKTDNKTTFADLIKQVNFDILESQKYDYYSLADIQKNSQVKNGLINHLVIFENYPWDESKLNDKLEHADLKITNYKSIEQINYDFGIMLSKSEDLVIQFIYNGKKYSEEGVKAIGDHFINIIKDVTTCDSIKISDIEMLSLEEKNKILIEFNDTKVDYPKDLTIHQLFEKQVVRTPHHTALVFNDKKLSYMELNERANSLARILRKKGVKAETVVGIMVQRSFEMIIGILGILKAGGAYVPIDPEYPEERLKYIIGDSQIQIVLTQDGVCKNIDMYKDRLVDVIDLQNEELYKEEIENLDPINQVNHLAYIIYTSGSTGNPKGVMIEHGSVVNILLALESKYPLRETDAYLLKTTYTFDVSVAELFGWFHQGGRLAILEPGSEKEPGEIIKAIEKYHITHMNFVPSMLSLFLDMLDEKNISIVNKLKYIFAAGEPITGKLVSRFYDITSNVSLENIYGPTESTIYGTQYSLRNGWDMMNVPIGKPLPNINAYVIGKDNHLQPIGVIGELCLAGGGLARGYLNKVDLTNEKFIQNPFIEGQKMYRTGDLARWLPNGDIEILGRLDYQVKIRGFRIELGEIERNLVKIEGLKEAIVLERVKAGNRYLCAYYVSEMEYSVNKLRAKLEKQLPDYMIPLYFIKLEKMPLMVNGKLDRKSLPEPNGEVNTGVEYVEPRNEIEEKLVSIWKKLLGVNKISIYDNFFSLGGHSLKAMILAGRMNKELNVDVKLKEIFGLGTIKAIGEHILKSKNIRHEPIQKAEEKEYYEASSAQKRMYLLQQENKDSTAYNMPSAIEIVGGFDFNQFKFAFETIIQRHEILRTTFNMIGGIVYQKINQFETLDFHIERLQVSNEVEVQSIYEKFIQPFDLKNQMLIRVKVINVSDEKNIILLDMHHIISDGTSIEIMKKELNESYSGKSLAKPLIQYKDYSEWQKKRKESEYYKKQEDYWLKEFQGEIPELNIPADYERTEQWNFDGDHVHFEMDEATTKALHEVAKKTGSTLYMALLSCVNILLSKYSGQDDIIVGSPIAGRNHTDLENVLGMFVNTLAIRTTINGKRSFQEYIQSVKEKVIQDYANQDYQFEDLISAIKLERKANKNPLFDIAFVYQNIENGQSLCEELVFKEYMEIKNTQKFDLSIVANDLNGKISMEFEFATGLFKRETIETMKLHFIEIMQQIIKKPEIKIEEIKLTQNFEKVKELQYSTDFNF